MVKKQRAQIRTDKDGKATFTITGTNATVTPIAFVDGSNQYWDANAGHRDFRTYADNRFDKETEIFVKAPAVTFGAIAYKIEVIGDRTNEATVSEIGFKDKQLQITQLNGREYKIEVTKPDGTPFAGATVNVGIDRISRWNTW